MAQSWVVKKHFGGVRDGCFKYLTLSSAQDAWNVNEGLALRFSDFYSAQRVKNITAPEAFVEKASPEIMTMYEIVDAMRSRYEEERSLVSYTVLADGPCGVSIYSSAVSHGSIEAELKKWISICSGE